MKENENIKMTQGFRWKLGYKRTENSAIGQ
jgi:hypothetical protein